MKDNAEDKTSEATELVNKKTHELGEALLGLQSSAVMSLHFGTSVRHISAMLHEYHKEERGL